MQHWRSHGRQFWLECRFLLSINPDHFTLQKSWELAALFRRVRDVLARVSDFYWNHCVGGFAHKGHLDSFLERANCHHHTIMFSLLLASFPGSSPRGAKGLGMSLPSPLCGNSTQDDSAITKISISGTCVSHTLAAGSLPTSSNYIAILVNNYNSKHAQIDINGVVSTATKLML